MNWRLILPDVLESEDGKFTICRHGGPSPKRYLAWRRRERQTAELIGAYNSSDEAKAAVDRLTKLDPRSTPAAESLPPAAPLDPAQPPDAAGLTRPLFLASGALCELYSIEVYADAARSKTCGASASARC